MVAIRPGSVTGLSSEARDLRSEIVSMTGATERMTAGAGAGANEVENMALRKGDEIAVLGSE